MKELFLLKNGQYELTELGKELASLLEIPINETVNKIKIDILIENKFNKWYADYEDPVLNGFQYHIFLPEFNQRQQQIMAQREPFTRLGFASDILRGVPSGQYQYTQEPSTNPFTQALGLGIAGLGAYNQFQGN